MYEKIKSIAKSKGVKIADIEREIDIAPRSMSNWKTTKPTYDKVVAVAKYLGVTVEELTK